MVSYGNFQDITALSTALTAIWERDLVTESPLDPLFNMANSNRAVERTQELGNFGLVEEYNGAIEYDDPDLGTRKEFLHKEYAKGLKIPRKLLDDDDYAAIGRMTSNMALSFTRTMAYHKSSVFNEAFATTYTVADGKALCATTGRSTGKANTANAGTDALSAASVKATRKAMMSFTDKNGLKLLCVPDTLVVPIDLMDEAEVIVTSIQASGTQNNDANTLKNLNIIVDPLLTDSNNWFLVDSGMARQHLWWWNRVSPEFSVHPASEHDLELRQRGYMRYSFGADDHTWIYGHNVADA